MTTTHLKFDHPWYAARARAMTDMRQAGYNTATIANRYLIHINTVNKIIHDLKIWEARHETAIA
jgi:hypothetical protein